MENEKWKMDKCKKKIKNEFNDLGYNITYEKFKKEPNIDNLYDYIITWNRAIGVLKSKSNIELVKSILKKIKIIPKPSSLNEQKKFLKNIIELFNNANLGNRNLKIPSLKIAHILYPDIFPLIDNPIQKEFIGSINLNVDEFVEFILAFRDCLNKHLPKNIDYKTFDEYMFLVYSKDNKNLIDIECYKMFENIKHKIKECIQKKLNIKRKKLENNIGILCAMREELEPVLKMVEVKETVEYGKNIYYKAVFEGKELVLAYSKIGKVNASTTATVLIERFGAKKLLFSGVAGAVDKDLKIGDLIIATKTCQHDVDLTVFGYEPGFIPESKVFFECDEKLNSIAENVAENMGIKLKKGIIASGDQFIHSRERKEWIEKTFKASAIEMEGGAVGCVCWTLDVPFFMLRAISDTAEEGAGIDFDEFLEESSKVSAEFLIKMLKEINE